MSEEAKNFFDRDFNELEVSELREKLYLRMKEIRWSITGAAALAGCSAYQMRLVLKGIDQGPEILLKAAEWVRNHQREQKQTLAQFCQVAREAANV